MFLFIFCDKLSACKKRAGIIQPSVKIFSSLPSSPAPLKPDSTYTSMYHTAYIVPKNSQSKKLIK